MANEHKQIFRHHARLRGVGVLLLSMLFVSCEDLAFLNPNSPTLDDIANISVQSLVTGAEGGMRTDLDIYLVEVSVVGREALYFEPADPRYTGELLKDLIDPGGFLLNRTWTARYNVIANCNLLLDKPESEMPDKQVSGVAKDKAKLGVDGFAQTIMAYQLLLNLNLLNENGVKLVYTGVLDNFSTKDESFAEIARLLDAGFTDLGNAGTAFAFGLSDGFDGFDTPATFAQFNRALKARVAVYRGNWQAALDALADSFLDESGDELDLGVYNVYSTASNDLSNGLYENPTADFIKWMGHPTFASDADSGDARSAAKVMTRAESTTFDDLTSDQAITWLGSSTDPTPIIRNEELILLKAEANIGLAGDGLTEINIIRAAHGLADATTGGLDQLLHEKRYSLFLEGHRWVDMRRYGKLGELPLDRDGDAMITNFPRPETEVTG